MIELRRAKRGTAHIRMTPGGAKLEVRRGTSDLDVLEQVFIVKEYDHECLPKTARTIIDAGANVGYASVFFAEKYPEANIVAIEPDSANYGVLTQNVRGLNVRPLKAALWPRKATLGLENPAAASWAFTVGEGATGGESVAAVTVMDVLDPNQPIDIFKIDIEGSERELFDDSCQVWLARVGCLILELHDWIRPGCTDAVERAMSHHKHRRYTRGENVFYVRD